MPTRKGASVQDYIIDFSKEEGGGGRAKYKPGTYHVRVLAAKPTTSANKGTPGLEVTFQFLDGKNKGKKMEETLWASPRAFSRFRSLFEALGLDVPKKVKLTQAARDVKGGKLYIEIVKEKAQEGYEPRSVVAFDGFIHEDDYDPDDDAEDDEDEVEEDDEDLEEEEEDEDEEEEDDEDEDEDDEEEEEEEEPPARKKRRPAAKSKASAKAKPKTRTRKKKAKDDDDDEELEELDLDDL